MKDDFVLNSIYFQQAVLNSRSVLFGCIQLPETHEVGGDCRRLEGKTLRNYKINLTINALD